jgi:diacylglycerol kinase (ATP)
MGAGKVLVILNPVAGYGRSGKLRPLVEERLKAHGVDFEIVETDRRGHAVELAAAAATGGFGMVVAMGGDGTLSEVLHGLITSQGSPGSPHLPPGLKVAVIPSGTGNDFLSGSNLLTNWEDAVGSLVDPVTRQVDVLQLTDASGFRRYVANSVGIGYDAYVAKRVAELGTQKIGSLSYMVEALRGLLYFNPAPARIASGDGPGKMYDGLWLFAVTNSEKFGGGMRVSPGARIDDGVLNYAFLHGVPRRSLVSLIFLVRSGKHAGKPGVVMDTADCVTIDVPEGFPCHVDGDTVDVKYPVSIRVLPGILPFVVGGAPAAR